MYGCVLFLCFAISTFTVDLLAQSSRFATASSYVERGKKFYERGDLGTCKK